MNSQPLFQHTRSHSIRRQPIANAGDLVHSLAHTRETGDPFRSSRHTMFLVIVMQELRLHFCNVNIRRTFRLTPFASQTKIHHLFDSIVSQRTGHICIRHDLSQNISPRPCCVLLIPCRHKTGTHHATSQLSLATVARAATHFRGTLQAFGC